MCVEDLFSETGWLDKRCHEMPWMYETQELFTKVMEILANFTFNFNFFQPDCSVSSPYWYTWLGSLSCRPYPGGLWPPSQDPPRESCRAWRYVSSKEVKLPTIWTDEKQRWEESEKRREEERRSKRESLRRKKIQVREKVGKSQNTVICSSGGSKSRLAKAAGAEPFGKMRDEQLHAVVARSTFASEKAKNTSRSEHLWKLRCRKSACRCGAKHISKSKCAKHLSSGPLLEVEMSKKCTPLWRKARFHVKMLKTPGVRTTFGRCLRGRRKKLCTWSKVSKTWGFCSISKNDGRRGTFEEDLQRCIFRGRRRRDMFIRAVRRSGRWFPEKGCILEH